MHVFPTRNIHLVKAYPNARIDLTLCVDWPLMSANAVWTDVSTLPGTKLDGDMLGRDAAHPPPAQMLTQKTAPASPTGISLVPTDVGTGFYFVAAAPGGKLLNALLRVAVHNDIERLFLPYGLVPMVAGRDDFVLTVFARFDDHETWDVTEHPYLEFGSDNPDIAIVDPATGRITAHASGDANVWVQPIGRQALRQNVVVRVSTLAERIAAKDLTAKYLQQPAGATRTLFLVSEGFVDPLRYEQRAMDVASNLFAEANAPFRWLKNSWNIVSVYMRSAGVRGITLGRPLDDRGFMIDTDPVLLDGHRRFDAARPSAFGLMYTERVGDVNAGAADPNSGADFQPNDLLDHGHFNPALVPPVYLANPDDLRSIRVDLRRVGPYRGGPHVIFDPRAAFLTRFEETLAALQLQLGQDDRVAFLVDDQLRGGAGFSVAGLEIVPKRFVSMTTGPFDIDVPFDGIQPQPPSPLVVRVPQSDPYHAGYFAASVAHELGHTFRLGDEYEGKDLLPPHRIDDDGSRLLAEAFDNLQLNVDVIDNGAVNKDRIKWNTARVAKASRIVSIRKTPGTTLMVTIAGDPRKLWKPLAPVRLRSSYATPRPLAANGTVDVTVPRLREFHYDLNDIIGNELMLVPPEAVPTDAELADLRVIYMPLEDDHGQLDLIDRAVEVYLTGPGGGPFDLPGRNGISTERDGIAPQGIANLRYPTFPSDVVGLYQGGMGWARTILRPAGRCKMRHPAGNIAQPVPGQAVIDELIEFCFVCKFIITDQIDPSMLPKVQLHYPKDC